MIQLLTTLAKHKLVNCILCIFTVYIICNFILIQYLMIAAWQEVEQKLGEGSQPENGKGPVQYAERSPNPGMKSQSGTSVLFTFFKS